MRGAIGRPGPAALTFRNSRSRLAHSNVFYPRIDIRAMGLNSQYSIGGFVMSISIKRSLTIAATLALLTAVAGTASADTTWQKNHPRREQVNGRLNNQNKRIHN